MPSDELGMMKAAPAQGTGMPPQAARRLSFARWVRYPDLPDYFLEGEIYIVGGPGREVLWFLCPCGCEDNWRIPVGTQLTSEPRRWTLTHEADGTITLSPSLLSRGGCRSHYFITHNLIQWV
jgi:hypothetical protein